EIKEILKDDAAFYSDYFGITEEGNWEENKNIPDVNSGKKDFTVNEQITQKLVSLNKKLFEEREKRIRPATDDKILTSWNSLMAKGFIVAYQTFGEESFLKSAKRNIDFLLKNICTEDNSLFRNYKNGHATIYGFLDDYAFFITALIEYYQASFDESFLQKAKSLTEYVITSSNSEMAKNLFLLSQYFDDKDYEEKSVQMIKNVSEDLVKNLGYYSNWAQAMLLQVFPATEIAIVGKDWKEKLVQLQKTYLPNTIYSGGENERTLSLLQNKLTEGRTLIYVCKNKSCDLPVENVAQALTQIEN